MLNSEENNAYLAFLRYCLDPDNVDMPGDAKSIDWRIMMLWAERQSIVGVLFNGIQKADKSLKIPKEVLFEWIGYVNQIEGQNRLLNKRCIELTEHLGQNGFDSCILKGQGNALMYPNPLLRMPGDIDVWVMPKSDVRCKKEDVKRVIWFAREKNPGAKACYHHVDYGEFNGVEVELHYRPSFMFNPLHNFRLQKWFRSHTESTEITELPNGVGCISVPSWEFNIVFQLSHVYNHILHEGIGLRQIIDYYYLLKSNTNRTNDTNYFEILQYLGLEKIAGAMMWMLHEKLGLEEEYLIAPMDKKRGKYVLNEILRGGNFGYYDENNKKADSPFKKNIQRLKRDIRMMRYFPSECLWEPIFRVYHFFWRLRYN